MSDITSLLLRLANGQADSTELLHGLLDHPTWYARRRDNGFTDLHARLDADAIGAEPTTLLDALDRTTHLRVASGGLGQIFEDAQVDVIRGFVFRETGTRLIRALDAGDYDALFAHELFIGVFDVSDGTPIATNTPFGVARAAFVTPDGIAACKAVLAPDLARSGVEIAFHRVPARDLFGSLTVGEAGVGIQAFGPGRPHFIDRSRCAATASRAR